MLRHYIEMYRVELDIANLELKHARERISKLVVMNASQAKEIATLKIEKDRAEWELSDHLLAASKIATAGYMKSAFGPQAKG